MTGGLLRRDDALGLLRGVATCLEQRRDLRRGDTCLPVRAGDLAVVVDPLRVKVAEAVLVEVAPEWAL